MQELVYIRWYSICLSLNDKVIRYSYMQSILKRIIFDFHSRIMDKSNYSFLRLVYLRITFEKMLLLYINIFMKYINISRRIHVSTFKIMKINKHKKKKEERNKEKKKNESKEKQRKKRQKTGIAGKAKARTWTSRFTSLRSRLSDPTAMLGSHIPPVRRWVCSLTDRKGSKETTNGGK